MFDKFLRNQDKLELTLSTKTCLFEDPVNKKILFIYKFNETSLDLFSQCLTFLFDLTHLKDI